MSEKEKKAVDYLQLCYDLSTIGNESLSKLAIILNLIEKQQEQLQEKDKIIDLMAEQLAGLTIYDNDIESPLILGDAKEVIEYYEKKVREV